MPTYAFRVGPSQEDVRLDVFLADRDEPSESRSQVKKRIDEGEIELNGETVSKGGHFLRPGDEIVWHYEPVREPDLEPQDIPIDILHEADEWAIVDKPAGMVVHPAPGHPDGTLVNALLHHLDELSSVGGERRPGIVHRIDKETSGALVVSKTDRAHHHLADLFREHEIRREYHALIFGESIPDAGTFDTSHGRDPANRIRYTGKTDSDRRAVTHYRVRERFDSGAALVECRLETGRTHQIRMHFYEANAPVLGDSTYAGRATSSASVIDRQALHARTLGFRAPSGREVDATAPYPEDFERALSHLRTGGDWR
ncbi:MAG: RluA family pseudouridine synthase [Bradymonadaceae bacterium]